MGELFCSNEAGPENLQELLTSNCEDCGVSLNESASPIKEENNDTHRKLMEIEENHSH